MEYETLLKCYDRDGNTISSEEWVLRLKKDNRVAYSETKNYSISTVYLGINHRYDGKLPPYIFETLVFADDDTLPWDDYMQRYSTEEEAILGHLEVLKKIREEEAR